MASEAGELFDDLPECGTRVQSARPAKGPARILMPNRLQIELRPNDLESLLPEGHRARIVWGYVEGQDLSGMYEGIKAREGGAGRSAIAPEILFALWLYATLENEGRAREVARLTQADDAYRWICGGVQVNHHTLSDFRVAHAQALDELLTDSVASLMAAGVVKLKRVAQDGMRVRASAGAGSFRRKEKLERYLEHAKQQVAAFKQQIEDGPGTLRWRSQAAKERAVRERQARVQKALDRLPELDEIKKRQGKNAKEARASTTDAEATVMKMGDGGFRPAYNVQYGTDSEAVAEWRERMGTEEAKTIYKDRATTAECVNAQARQRGLTQFRVRGLAKVKCVVLLFALAHNLMRMLALVPELVGIGTGTSSVPNLVT